MRQIRLRTPLSLLVSSSELADPAPCPLLAKDKIVTVDTLTAYGGGST